MLEENVEFQTVADERKLRLTRVHAIKQVFDPVRKVDNKEIMDMTPDVRRELGDWCLQYLGAELLELQA